MMVGVAAHEGHEVLGLVGETETEDVLVELPAGVVVGDPEHDVVQPQGLHIAGAVSVRPHLEVGDQLDEHPSRVSEPQCRSDAGFEVAGGRYLDRKPAHAECVLGSSEIVGALDDERDVVEIRCALTEHDGVAVGRVRPEVPRPSCSSVRSRPHRSA
ncbi:hypothetical protein MMA15_26560 [Streptomyces sp. M600PL45_2]|uniref:Uncharacterized protein n=1 Tax=Streptomyces marispadix TaxID=2922868 RepID=A0ABS9T5L0_9ACTN|nr:hypothetical protein [Streptomyces marispadix]MCH6163833.1 hypothetical protein [Streptomyces marispadix]